MNQQTADDLIDKAVKKAIKEYAKEEKRERKNKALHNTKMLLKNDEKIKSSIEEAVSEANQLVEDCMGYSDEEDVYINSIRKSKLKSLIVIAHINKALALTKEEYEQKDMLFCIWKVEQSFNLLSVAGCYSPVADSLPKGFPNYLYSKERHSDYNG